MSIRIKKIIYEQMIIHAQSGYPNEVCGILAGKDGKSEVYFPMRNMDESPVSYFMDPKEQLHIFKQMRQGGLVMTGIFHSHVASEAAPSQKDVRLAFYPDVSYLIVSLTDLKKPVLRSFQINNEVVTEEKIEII